MGNDFIERADKGTSVALLIIDVINKLDFPEADLLKRYTQPMAENIASLKKRAKEHHIPVIYVNDNYGMWRSDLNQLIEKTKESPGKDLVEALMPQEDDYFVVKPKHSGFFSTPLASLLKYLEVNTLILTGVAGNICVLFTANDAYMRDYNIYVPSDCSASNEQEDNEYALRLMENIMEANTEEESKLDLVEIINNAVKERVKTAYEG
ncbi:cysteine hydrolase family protein [Pseudalkalibacillus caeni]|uniref:Cysteine hydrolase n=1 Tax=Exobacillus caeni TaxID=2574798 RepID=A0A5R9EXW3_9BACL|nr:isochorismatase family cysteine hydrolase [Pseudalkalibacillus caeni]TLS35016.1 cysteine hydrolase [Pseudalkalibacillus caeni]